MKLNYKKSGNGKAVIILHGLYGSSDNWFSIARALSEYFCVYSVDIRNHGQSPHSTKHTYKEMAADLEEFTKNENLTKFYLIGHSMGGKIAMEYSINNSARILSMIIIDIAPKDYSIDNKAFDTHKKIINSMLNLNLYEYKSRLEIDSELKKEIKEDRVRAFILKNLKRDKNNKFDWKLNILAIDKNIKTIMANNLEQYSALKISSPCLFVKAANSSYIDAKDYNNIRNIFPNSQIEIIDNCGHWVHAEQPNILLKTILYFLDV
ncbi:MAG: alpha/beta fold hydrolase [Marinifilaceae bacterium]|jgi:pimeloyl-ACP methyl ester carboxylesterase|nr:alpha/beta fold hydrolase [Marinifilaceae bacterium]